jgi:hypothetical protein
VRLEITPNFITQEECALLNAWVYEGVSKKWLDKGFDSSVHFTDKRLTSRPYGHRFTYPKEVIDLSNKIKRFVGISNYPIIQGHGKDGIVVSYTKPGGSVHAHVDPKIPETGWYSALRCNIMTQAAEENGDLFVDGIKINIKAGDLHCYLASDFEHYVTEVKGNTPRILWMFGAYVPKEDWENGTIKYGLS